MITFSKIGKKGNLGNQFFQIAATIGFAIDNNFEYGFLPWQYQKYFKNKLPVIDALPTNIEVIQEKQYHHYGWDFNKETNHYDVVGWLQSEKYFNIPKTKYYFEFEADLIESIKEKYAEAFAQKTILISIRRGDFVNHPDYLQLSIQYYLNALVQFFPDWQSRNIIVLSDDINYCKFHFSFLENAFFGDHLNAIEQLCLGSLCDDFIISNSTFSWWSAWLGEKESSKIIRPHQNFDGNKRLESDDKDYFPERWIAYDASKDRIPLNGVTFYLDFKNNQTIIKDYLLHYFDVAVVSDANAFNETKNGFCFKNDYILPPLMLYYTCLKIDFDKENIVLNHAESIVKVSKILNYKEFTQQSDFGMFSSVFNFKKKQENKVTQTIHLVEGAPSDSKKQEKYLQNKLTLSGTVGQFSKTGFSFSFKRFLKNVEITIKSTIKRMLFPKKS